MVLQFGLAASLSYMAIALLSLPMVGRTVIAFGLLCHLRACCLGSRCAMVLRFGLAALLSYGQSRCSAFYGWPHRCCFRITLPSPRLLPQQHVCHGSSVWPCSLTQLEQSRCSAYGWPHRCCFRITLPSPRLLPRQQVCHGSSVWPCGLTQLEQLRCSAYLWLAAPLLLSDKLLCHLHTCCLYSRCAIVL